MILTTFADVVAADSRVRPFAIETPLLRADALDEATGGKIFVKAECLQGRGAFKIRGAANALLQVAPEDRARGVVAFSSGNHAQAVAYMAKHLGMPATIIVPSDAPKGKLEAVARDGATIVTYDRVNEDREAIGKEIADRTGAILVEPFDNVHVIAGQGTCGLEILRQAPDIQFDHMVCCASGGGLAAGIGLVLEELSPKTALLVVEPATHDDLARSLALGQRIGNEPGTRSIQDALMSQYPGLLTLPILSRIGATGTSVTDEQALHAMAFAFKYFRLVLEPGGAAALAAVLNGKIETKGKTIGVVASGGNVDADVFRRALALV